MESAETCKSSKKDTEVPEPLPGDSGTVLGPSCPGLCTRVWVAVLSTAEMTW